MSKPKPGLGKGIGKGIARTLSVVHATPDYSLIPTWDPPDIVLSHSARLRHPPASTRLPIFRVSAVPRPYLSQPYSYPYPCSYSYSTLSASAPAPAQPMPVLYPYPSLPSSTNIDALLSALELNSHTSYTSIFNSSSNTLDSSPCSSSPSSGSSSSARPTIPPVPYSSARPCDPPSPRSAQQSLKSRSLNSLSSSLDSSSTTPPPAHTSGGGSDGAGTFGTVISPLATCDGGGLPSSSFIFHLGASGLAKDRPRTSSSSPSPTRPSIPPRPRSFPLHPIPSPPSSALHSVSIGEDSYFTRPDGLCIADGVGAWARSGRGGADAGRWSALMTHFCEVEVGDWWSGKDVYLKDPKGKVKGKGKERDKSSSVANKGSSGNKAHGESKDKGKGKSSGVEEELAEGERERRPLDPVEIMQRGYEKCLSCAISELTRPLPLPAFLLLHFPPKQGINGSSTCLLALLHNSTLHIANLGDCCLLLIRGGKVVFRTEEMQHAFNFPLQVGTHSRDEPMKDAMRFDVPVKKGDIVIVASDGLMDNMFDEDILEVLSQLSPPPSPSPSPPPPHPPSSTHTHSHIHTHAHTLTLNPQKASEALCTRARQISETTTTTTPFMCAAIEEGIDFVGGKKDDISVLVGVVGVRNLKDLSVKDGLAGVEEQGQAQGKEGEKERLMLYH
uniref:Protein phosphatase n=1 Tax=Cryptococcus bacillisporus CA1280 TaxID=1296109 RepID=A0A0D0VIY3_CRYGA|nr:hypothetical protein I312_03132 [Cryptococcus bacillisporus CA1280]